jgi:hypothetical protein
MNNDKNNAFLPQRIPITSIVSKDEDDIVVGPFIPLFNTNRMSYDKDAWKNDPINPDNIMKNMNTIFFNEEDFLKIIKEKLFSIEYYEKEIEKSFSILEKRSI